LFKRTLGSLLDAIHTGTVLFFHLFDRVNSSAKVSELGEFLLDCLETFLPLAMSNVSQRFISAFTPILLIRLSKLCDLHPETPNLFAKHC